MKYVITSFFILQTVCVLQTVSFSIRQSNRNAAFDEWLSNLDPSIEGEEKSALCTGVPDGFYAFPGECSSTYYACRGGSQFNLTCENNFVFEPATGSCVDPANAPCKTTTRATTPTTARTTVAPFTCGADGNYPVGTCTPSYYICIGGGLYPQTCPTGVFNTETLTCTSAEAAGCTTTTPGSGTTELTCAVDGNYPSAPCSNMYYTCIGGQKYEQFCPVPSATFYNKTCVSQENNPNCATTAAQTTTTPSTTTPSTTTPTTTTPSTTTPSTTTPSTTTPSTTTQPITTTPSTTTPSTTTPSTTTPSTTTPSTTTQPITTTTTTRPTTTRPTTTTVLPPFSCPEPNGFFPLGPNICSSEYYSCVNGAPYVRTCPAGIFDPVYMKCVLPESASPTCYVAPTTTTTMTTTTTTTTTTPPPPFVCPAVGQYPVQGSCTLYYVCSSSGYIVASCPVGEVFNPSTQFCEKPGNVAGCNFYSFVEFYQGMRKVGLRGTNN